MCLKTDMGKHVHMEITVTKEVLIVTDSWEQELLQDIPQRARNQSGQEAGKRENLGKSLYCGYHGENSVTKLSGLSGISIG